MRPQEIYNLEAENSFNYFFKLLEIYSNKTNHSGRTKEIYNSIKKRDVIIFVASADRLNKINDVYSNQKIIFPFDKMYVECPIIKMSGEKIIVAPGIFIHKVIENEKKFIMISSLWRIFPEGYDSDFITLPVHFLLDETWTLAEHNNTEIDFTLYDISKDLQELMLNYLKKFMSLIQIGEYKTYKKMNADGTFSEREIIYAHDVREHKRHFWKETKRWRISSMSKEELFNNGYGVDEVVIKDGEIKRDVPYRIINQFRVGEESNTPPEANKKIFVFEKRQFKREQLLGDILKEIFQNEHIRHNKSFQGNLRLDWHIWKKRIAFEYDGEQHFSKELYEQLYGKGFEEQRARDNMKDKMCRKKKIRLIRIKYDEPLTKQHILKRLKEEGIKC